MFFVSTFKGNTKLVVILVISFKKGHSYILAQQLADIPRFFIFLTDNYSN